MAKSKRSDNIAASQVWTPDAPANSYTYVNRNDKEDELWKYLARSGVHPVVIGPSMIGKTSFVKNIIPKENQIYICCVKGDTLASILDKTLDYLSLHPESFKEILLDIATKLEYSLPIIQGISWKLGSFLKRRSEQKGAFINVVESIVSRGMYWIIDDIQFLEDDASYKVLVDLAIRLNTLDASHRAKMILLGRPECWEYFSKLHARERNIFKLIKLDLMSEDEIADIAFFGSEALHKFWGPSVEVYWAVSKYSLGWPRFVQVIFDEFWSDHIKKQAESKQLLNQTGYAIDVFESVVKIFMQDVELNRPHYVQQYNYIRDTYPFKDEKKSELTILKWLLCLPNKQLVTSFADEEFHREFKKKFPAEYNERKRSELRYGLTSLRDADEPINNILKFISSGSQFYFEDYEFNIYMNIRNRRENKEFKVKENVQH
jgi:hypothetical protein